MIQKIVIEEKKIMSFKTLKNAYDTYYKDLLLEKGGSIDDSSSIDKKLLDKIKKNFKNIQLITHNKNVLVVA